MCFKTQFIRSFDQAGVPVTLNLENKGEHKTWVGGCCSLLVIVLTTLIIIPELFIVFKGETFDFVSEIEYVDESTE